MSQKVYEVLIYNVSFALKQNLDVDDPSYQFSPFLREPVREARELKLDSDEETLKDYFGPGYFDRIARRYS